MSAMNLLMPWRTTVLPSGSITQAIRQGIQRLYVGILASAPVQNVAAFLSGGSTYIPTRYTRYYERRKRIIYVP